MLNRDLHGLLADIMKCEVSDATECCVNLLVQNWQIKAFSITGLEDTYASSLLIPLQVIVQANGRITHQG
jgi:hypothetical protein